jgi:homoserine dehydrogenase
MSAQPLKVALAGLGTVGGGTAALLADQAKLLEARAGRPIKLVAVSALEKTPGVPLGDAVFYDDARKMVAEADYDLLAELIGGSGGIALEIVKGALAKGKHVVTANKAMIAHHGVELAKLAETLGAQIGFEASVGGGIPIIKSLREGLAGNRVTQVKGILNGTCNYILTTMRSQGRDFADVLAEAQKLGYAEADPSFDIDGVDTAHKLAILAALAFAMPIDIEGVACEGIRHVSALDIQYADELGYRIKLLGVASLSDHGVEARVYPAMVPLSFPLAHVDGVFNAIVTEGDFVGRTVLEGRGAGARPTASAVVADIVDIARGHHTPTFGVPLSHLKVLPKAPAGEHVSAYYIRLMVRDEPGVFADIAAALRDEQVSMEQIIQRGRSPGESVPVVMTVHETKESSMQKALKRIGALAALSEPPHLIRIESA